jgi:hypothetical protein
MTWLATWLIASLVGVSVSAESHASNCASSFARDSNSSISSQLPWRHSPIPILSVDDDEDDDGDDDKPAKDLKSQPRLLNADFLKPAVAARMRFAWATQTQDLSCRPLDLLGQLRI